MVMDKVLMEATTSYLNNEICWNEKLIDTFIHNESKKYDLAITIQGEHVYNRNKNKVTISKYPCVIQPLYCFELTQFTRE